MCGVECGAGTYKSRLSKYTYSLVNHTAVIQRNTCKTHILKVNSGLFDTRVKILTLAPVVVPVTNMRYDVHVFQTQIGVLYIKIVRWISGRPKPVGSNI